MTRLIIVLLGLSVAFAASPEGIVHVTFVDLSLLLTNLGN
jgi:hypothetical protein